MKIKTIWKEFFNPRFSTSEMESSRTRSGRPYGIDFLIYDDFRPHYPVTAVGKVATATSKLIVTWDRHGKCTLSGQRLPEYDLIRPTQKEIDAGKPAFIAMLGIFIMVIITLILE